MAVASNLTDISLCEATTNFTWSGGPTWSTKSLAADDFPPIEGTYMLGTDLDVETGLLWYDVYAANGNVSQDYSGRHFHVWLWVITASFLDTKTNGGIGLMLQDSSGNEGYWYVGGSDTYVGGWAKWIIDCDSTPTTNNGTDPTVTSINKVGLRVKATAKSKLGENTLTDLWQWGSSTSHALSVTGGTSGTPLTWADVLSADLALSKPTGIIEEFNGVYYIQGPFLFGDTGTGDTYFNDEGQTIVWKDTLASSAYFDITITGNGTGTTSFVIGNVTGSGDSRFGYSGGTITAAGSHAWTFDAETNTSNIDECFLYGVNMIGSGVMQFDDNTDTQILISCTWDDCGMVQPNEALILNSFFLNATGNGAVEMLNGDDDNIRFCTWKNCTNAIYLPSGQTSARTLVTADIDATYDFYNDSGSVVTVNADATCTVDDTTNPSGSAITLVTSRNVDIAVKDPDNVAIEDAKVTVWRATRTDYTSDTGNNAGDGDFVVNETIDTDQAQTGHLFVWNKSNNWNTSLRYASWTSLTFTLASEVTGSVTTTGTATQLIDSAAAGWSGVQVGDPIRNTTDGSWANVAEIVSSTELKTTALQGGAGDKVWTLSDNYSLNRLPFAFTDNDDIVEIPLYHDQTDASGDIATYSHNYSAGAMAITIDVSQRDTTPKYISLNDIPGTIGANGYSAIITLQEDTVDV